MVTPKTKCRGVYIFVTGAARARSEVCRHAVVITNTTFDGAFDLSSAVKFIELTSHVRASVPQLQHSYKLPNCTLLDHEERTCSVCPAVCLGGYCLPPASSGPD